MRYAYLSDDGDQGEDRSWRERNTSTRPWSSGRGLMMITGHIGNWEILAHVPRLLGIQFCVMADRREDPRLESIVDGIRSRSGATILPPTGKALMLIRELRKGNTIGVVVDGRGRGKGRPFLRRSSACPPSTNPAPAFIAIKGSAIVLPVCGG
ncbi:MAG: lysophospholipid acyltransferase family protein [Desulfomicrobium escambiense]|nr:lysophospholipid acyltransferase family protein [Desulfomicrobium escambiense]